MSVDNVIAIAGAAEASGSAHSMALVIFGVLVSIGAAYVAAMFNNVMDFLQLIFAFINAPLFATFLLGMVGVVATAILSERLWGLDHVLPSIALWVFLDVFCSCCWGG